MFPQRPSPAQRVISTLSVKIGGWFEAQATGAGVLAIPVLVIAVLLAALASAWLS